MQLIKTFDRVSLYRTETYCGRTTPLVRWVVKFIRDDGQARIVAECNTKREALGYFDAYEQECSMPTDEQFLAALGPCNK